jgi:hypothetical protein
MSPSGKTPNCSKPCFFVFWGWLRSFEVPDFPTLSFIKLIASWISHRPQKNDLQSSKNTPYQPQKKLLAPNLFHTTQQSRTQTKIHRISHFQQETTTRKAKQK